MADESQTTPSAFNCEGGLVLNKSTFMMQPGEALELENFEPDVSGGYRRINGYSKVCNSSLFLILLLIQKKCLWWLPLVARY